MLASAFICLAMIIPAPSHGDIRLINMTTDEIQTIGRDGKILRGFCDIGDIVEYDNSSMEEDKFKITVGLLMPGDQHSLGEYRH